ncbi:MAG: solute-binding protein, partial [Rhizobiales bacterium]|nr:solute-binding protein [Hyphomicrobiales bacterium]
MTTNQLILRQRRLIGAWSLIVALALACTHQALAGERVDARIFAAASLAGVIEQAASAGALEPGRRLRLVHASSGQLARQLMAGAGADLFIAADPRWTRELGTTQTAGDSAPVALFTGSLVLVAPLESTVSFAPVPGAD